MTAENVAAFPPSKPIVPLHRVVERIVNQTLDAVEAHRDPTARAALEAAADHIAQHPAQQALILSLAMDQLERMLDDAASERGIDLSYTFGSPPRVEATEEDLNYVPPED
jgi:hypothetical protein